MATDDISVAVADLDSHLFQSLHLQDGNWLLRGGRCCVCSRLCFPLKAFCPYCSANALQPEILPNVGVLYAFTTVHVSASRSTPYQLGYVDLDPQVRVLAILQTADTPLRIGMSLQLQVATTDMGTEWWFAPSGDTHV